MCLVPLFREAWASIITKMDIKTADNLINDRLDFFCWHDTCSIA